MAWNVWASINKRPLLPFRYQHLGSMMSLGKTSGAVSVPIPVPPPLSSSIASSQLGQLLGNLGIQVKPDLPHFLRHSFSPSSNKVNFPYSFPEPSRLHPPPLHSLMTPALGAHLLPPASVLTGLLPSLLFHFMNFLVSSRLLSVSESNSTTALQGNQHVLGGSINLLSLLRVASLSVQSPLGIEERCLGCFFFMG